MTYLADALRQVMVDGTAFAPLTTCAAVLLGWLVVCFAVAARKFRWQWSGPRGGLPALLVHELVEWLTPACPRPAA